MAGNTVLIAITICHECESTHFNSVHGH